MKMAITNYSDGSFIKCFTCNTWTLVAQTKERKFYDKSHRVCFSCERAYRIRADSLKLAGEELEVEDNAWKQPEVPEEG